MVRYLMAVAMKGMHQIKDVFMGVTMLFDLGVMLSNDLRQFGEVMCD
jgi:hypothetical protein